MQAYSTQTFETIVINTVDIRFVFAY